LLRNYQKKSCNVGSYQRQWINSNSNTKRCLELHRFETIPFVEILVLFTITRLHTRFFVLDCIKNISLFGQPSWALQKKTSQCINGMCQGILSIPGIAGYEWVPARIGCFYKGKIFFFHNTNGQ